VGEGVGVRQGGGVAEVGDACQSLLTSHRSSSLRWWRGGAWTFWTLVMLWGSSTAAAVSAHVQRVAVR
jgi:hypothetical protein